MGDPTQQINTKIQKEQVTPLVASLLIAIIFERQENIENSAKINRHSVFGINWNSAQITIFQC